MASNFYNLTGVMFGVDIHKYVMIPAIPTFNAHIAGAPFKWLTSTPHKIGFSVSMNGSASLRGGYSNCFVPHTPIPFPPPSPGEIPVLALVILNSGTKAQLTAHKVTHKGDALAVCVKSMLGVNVNCGDPFDMPTGVVLNLNSVETQPTAGDYAGAIAGYIVDAAIGFAIGKVSETWLKRKDKESPHEKLDKDLKDSLIKWVARIAPDVAKWLGDIQDPAGKAQEFVQKLVDGDEEATVPFLPPIIPPIKPLKALKVTR
jgi:hypothetical protein